jgi:uncharacterized protein
MVMTGHSRVATHCPTKESAMNTGIALESLRAKREHILDIAKRHGAFSVKIFGSTVRGDRGESSDVDFLVELEPDRSLMDLGGLLMDLQEFLDCKVDLAEPEGLHWCVRERILKEALPL